MRYRVWAHMDEANDTIPIIISTNRYFTYMSIILSHPPSHPDVVITTVLFCALASMIAALIDEFGAASPAQVPSPPGHCPAAIPFLYPLLKRIAIAPV